MLKLIKYLGISLLIGGCSPVGKYAYITSTHSTTVVLNSDRTFEYRVFTDLLGTSNFSGKWFKTVDTVNLVVSNPVDFYLTAVDSLFEIFDSIVPANMREIRVLLHDGTPVVSAQIRIPGDNHLYIADPEGRIVLSGKNVYEFSVSSSLIKSRNFVVNPEKNRYIVKIAESGTQPLVYNMFFHKWIWKQKFIHPIGNRDYKALKER